MGFVLPKGAKVRRGHDIDYSIQSVEFGKHRLGIGSGLTWSSGSPFPAQLLNMREMSERDVVFEGEVRGVEYRGVRTNGTYFRFVGKSGETIEYDGAPKETADYFDAIIDTLCKPAR
jgi:hypothetical protein